jgi:phosphatidylinositol dimannoside acyltransferase
MDVVARPIGLAVHELSPGYRAAAARNLARVLGRERDDPVVEAAVRACFSNFGSYVAEVMHVQGWSTDDFVDRVEVHGAENLDEAVAGGNGVIFVSAHMGSTEVAAGLAVLKGYHLTSITEEIRPAWLYGYLMESRARMGIDLLPASRAGVSLIRMLRRGGMVAMLVDVGIEQASSVPVRFFGHPAEFPDGPARLARLTGAPIAFGMAARLGGGRYEVIIRPPVFSDRATAPEADIARMTQTLASTLEGFVQKWPTQWYPFRRIWVDD